VVCEDSRVREIDFVVFIMVVLFLVGLSGTFFLDFFRGGIVSCFSTETTMGDNVGGSQIRLESPNTRVTNKNHEQECTRHEEWGDKESPKACARLKCCESLYTCPHAPFIGRRREFYIPRLPSKLWNISNVNTYKNVFYIP
jgi:hypothetical protein